MALLSDAMKEKEIDVRMINRGHQKGHLFKADLEKTSKNLPDDASNAEYTNVENLLKEVRAKAIRGSAH